MNIEIKTNKEGLKYFVLYQNKKMLLESDLYFNQDFLNEFKNILLEAINQTEIYIESCHGIGIYFNRNDLIGLIGLFLIQTENFLYNKLLPLEFNMYFIGENLRLDDLLKTLLLKNFEGDYHNNLRVLGVLFHSIQFLNLEGYYNGSSKIKSLDGSYIECESKILLDGLYFKDIEKIDNIDSGSRRMLLRVKGFQDDKIMSKYIDSYFNDLFRDFIYRKGFDAIAVIPNNIQRKVSLNQEIETYLKKLLPNIRFIEIGIQDFPERMPQKSTRGLCNRIENAEKLLRVEDIIGDYKNILLIDDVFGSGATMNAAAYKIKQQLPNSTVTGFAILSSYRKGFDVLSEI